MDISYPDGFGTQPSLVLFGLVSCLVQLPKGDAVKVVGLLSDHECHGEYTYEQQPR